MRRAGAIPGEEDAHNQTRSRRVRALRVFGTWVDSATAMLCSLCLAPGNGFPRILAPAAKAVRLSSIETFQERHRALSALCAAALWAIDYAAGHLKKTR